MSEIPSVIKYPRTEHLFDSGGSATSDDDLVCTEIPTEFCSGPTIIEEKVDGANLGIRVSDGQLLVQNRSRYISSGDHAQFSTIHSWIEEHREDLMNLLASEELILYGEWCFARHSIPYKRLPSYFVAFDLYNVKAKRFFSRARFHKALEQTKIPVVPTIGVTKFEDDQTSSRSTKTAKERHRPSMVESIKTLLATPSKFRDDGGSVEGVVLRQDSADWLLHRFKVVRPDFIRGITGDWQRLGIEKQRIDWVFAQDYLESCYVFASEALSPAPVSLTRHPCSRAKPRQQRVPQCIMLMGLPASGKSTFANRLQQGLGSDKIKTILVNQDLLGRKACIQRAGQASKTTRIILDRCNLTVAERLEWLKIMHSPSDVALVYFATPADTCIRRAFLRLNHPTMGQGKGGAPSIIPKLAKSVQVPTTKERTSVFSTVCEIQSWQDSDAVLREWGIW